MDKDNLKASTDVSANEPTQKVIATFCCKTCNKNFKVERSSNRGGPKIYCSIECCFWDRIDVAQKGCWPWPSRIRDGYPILRYEGKEVSPVRISYAQLHGFKSAKDFSILLNICGDNTCVRGDHWELKRRPTY